VVEARPGLPRALADPRALGDVLEHLLDNAVKYSPSGGTVWIRASGGRGAVEIAIEDEGVGLPASTSRIFGPFEQGESVDKRLHDEGGAGLGLFIVRTLVTRMRGAVRAERRSPRGARFVVQLRTAVPSGRIRRIA
jgi:signal transduction histidine kinase